MYAFTKRANELVTLLEASEGRPAVKMLFAPIDRKLKRLVSRATRGFAAGIGASATDKIDELTDEQFDALFDYSEAASREIIRLTAISWEGIGDGGEDPQPLALTPDREVRIATCTKPDRPTGTIDQLLDDEVLFEAADRLFVKAQANRDAEKNGSSVSSNGTGGAGTQGKIIADSPARPKRKVAVKGVRTAKTSSRPSKRKPSGTS